MLTVLVQSLTGNQYTCSLHRYYLFFAYLSSTRIFKIYEHSENLHTDTNVILSCENSQEGLPFVFHVWISLLLFNLTLLRYHSLGCSLLHFVASIHCSSGTLPNPNLSVQH